MPNQEKTAVYALVLNEKGEALLAGDTVVEGVVQSGGDSSAAALRCVKEQTGVCVNAAAGRLFFTEQGCDVYLFRKTGEDTSGNARWLLPEQIRADAALTRKLNTLAFWEKLFPYLYVESMRVRIPKGRYRHCKGNEYRVLGLALHSETVTPMVIYQALYGLNEVWTRPAEMWNEIVVKNGIAQPRFALIEREDDP